MNLFRSILFALFFYMGTWIVVFTAFPAAFLGQNLLFEIIIIWARYHRWCASIFLGIRSHIIGELGEGVVLVAAKHQSMFETIELLLLIDHPAVVMKQQLIDLPGWGWVARRYGAIPADRDGGAIALRSMFKAARAAVASGRSILIFPEGTRAQPGQKLPLQPGFAGIYKLLNVPVVPIALDSGRIWSSKKFIKQPGIVTIHIGKSLPPGLPRDEIEQQVHTYINRLET